MASATAVIPKRYTPEEYLALERKADYKSEYCNGFIIAMSGASREHNLIAGNFYRKISDQLEDRPCEALHQRHASPRHPDRSLHLPRCRGRLRRGRVPG